MSRMTSTMKYYVFFITTHPIIYLCILCSVVMHLPNNHTGILCIAPSKYYSMSFCPKVKTTDAIRRDTNIKKVLMCIRGNFAGKSQDGRVDGQKGWEIKKNVAFFSRSLQSSLIFWIITTCTTNTWVLEATLYVRNQPDGMAVAEIQSRYDLPEELPGLFGG